MWPFRKRAEDLDESDLQALIGAHETQFLEFKEIYARKDPKIRLEIARDVSAMANAEGGVIVVGMAADSDQIATKLVPVPDAETEATRLVQICDAAIDGRIVGLRTQPVAVSGGVVFVVAIPKSYRKPHQVIVNEPYEIWIRRDRRKSPMSVAEIREAVLVTDDLVLKVERFIAERRRAIREREASNPLLVLTATPLLLEEGRFAMPEKALIDLLKQPPIFRPNLAGTAVVTDHRASIEPSITGLRCTSNLSRLDVFRNGHMEFVSDTNWLAPQTTGGSRLLNGWAVVEFMMNLALLVCGSRNVLNITDPYLFTLAICGCRGIAMHQSGNTSTYLSPMLDINQFTDADDLLIGPVLATADEDPQVVTRTISGQLWNAFAYMRCPYVQADGSVKIG